MGAVDGGWGVGYGATCRVFYAAVKGALHYTPGARLGLQRWLRSVEMRDVGDVHMVCRLRTSCLEEGGVPFKSTSALALALCPRVPRGLLGDS